MKIKLDDGAFIPTRAHESDAGLDLYSLEEREILPRSAKKIDDYGRMAEVSIGETFDTGVHIELERGQFGWVTGRSGLNFNHDVICPGGTIDQSYRGSIKVKLYNLGTEPYTVKKGDRIAQLIIESCAYPEIEIVDDLGNTSRGSGGFGSTGK